jgi:hypothetical protein
LEDNRGKKLADPYAPIIVGEIIPPRTLEVQDAAELGPRVQILQEQYPGVPYLTQERDELTEKYVRVNKV